MTDENVNWEGFIDEMGTKQAIASAEDLAVILSRAYKTARNEGLSQQEALNVVAIMYWKPDRGQE